MKLNYENFIAIMQAKARSPDFQRRQREAFVTAMSINPWWKDIDNGTANGNNASPQSKETTMSTLEKNLSDLVHDFAFQIVKLIQQASFADVASLSPGTAILAKQVIAKAQDGLKVAPKKPRGERQTAAMRTQTKDRIVEWLRGASYPEASISLLSAQLSIPKDILTAPVRELLKEGRLQKNGDKRMTTYSVA